MRLNLAGAAVLVVVIVVSNLIGALKNYRQRLLNMRVMLSLRRALFDRLLHLPLPQTLGHEDRRHPVAAHRRHRHHHRAAADWPSFRPPCR